MGPRVRSALAFSWAQIWTPELRSWANRGNVSVLGAPSSPPHLCGLLGKSAPDSESFVLLPFLAKGGHVRAGQDRDTSGGARAARRARFMVSGRSHMTVMCFFWSRVP